MVSGYFPNGGLSCVFETLVQSQDTIIRKGEWVQNQLDRLENTNIKISQVILSMPELLSCSLEKNIEPTMEFYMESIETSSEGSKDDDKEKAVISMVMKDPRMLCAGLKTRLQPRLKEAQAANITVDGPCLKRMAKQTNVQWSASIENQSKMKNKFKQQHQKQ